MFFYSGSCGQGRERRGAESKSDGCSLCIGDGKQTERTEGAVEKATHPYRSLSRIPTRTKASRAPVLVLTARNRNASQASAACPIPFSSSSSRRLLLHFLHPPSFFFLFIYRSRFRIIYLSLRFLARWQVAACDHFQLYCSSARSDHWC